VLGGCLRRHGRLEVHLPETVGCRVFEAHPGLLTRRRVRTNQRVPMQGRGDGAGGWQRVEALVLEQPAELAGSPTGMRLAERHDRLLGGRRQLRARPVGPAGAILQASRPGFSKPMTPLVADPAADAEAAAQLPKRHRLLLGQHHELPSLLLHGNRLPGHDLPPLRRDTCLYSNRLPVTYVSGTSVTYLSGLYRVTGRGFVA